MNSNKILSYYLYSENILKFYTKCYRNSKKNAARFYDFIFRARLHPLSSLSPSLFPAQQSSLRALLFPGSQLLLLLWLAAEILSLLSPRRNGTLDKPRDDTMRQQWLLRTTTAKRDQSRNLVFLLKRQSSILTNDNRQSCLRNAFRGRLIVQRCIIKSPCNASPFNCLLFRHSFFIRARKCGTEMIHFIFHSFFYSKLELEIEFMK